MRKWLVKTFVQRAISCLPRSEWWNGLFQRYVTRGLHLEPDGEFRGKLVACRKHLDHFWNTAGRDPLGFSAVELGTGWFPILPLGLYLCGASQVWTYDIVRLLRPGTFRRTLECFVILNKSRHLTTLLPGLIPARMERLRVLLQRPKNAPPQDLLEELQVHALVTDVRRGRHPDGSIDFVFSNGVLEHLPRPTLVEVMTVFRRWLKADGVMCHHIGHADQFASFDRSITPFNFLKYPARRWRWLDNPLIPQNRLRHSDYVSILEESGFDPVKEDRISGRREDLRTVKLAPEFQSYNESDLLVLESWLVASPRHSLTSRLPAGSPARSA